MSLSDRVKLFQQLHVSIAQEFRGVVEFEQVTNIGIQQEDVTRKIGCQWPSADMEQDT